MAKGFVKFICDVEGKKPFVPPKEKISLAERHQSWPGDISDRCSFRGLIQEVLDVGVGRAFDPSLLDQSFVWATHPLESVFEECYEDGVVSETLYEYCKWADQNIDSMPSYEESWATCVEFEESLW